MGNTKQGHSSSVFVENTCLSSEPRSQPLTHRHYSAEKIDNYQRRLICSGNRLSAQVPKTKLIFSTKNIKQQPKQPYQKQRNLSYYPLQNVEKKLEENQLKFKQKIRKRNQKSTSNQKITKIQLLKLEKRNSKLIQCNQKGTKSNDKFYQPAIISPQNGIKRKVKGIKQNSLNKITLSPKNMIKQNTQVNRQNPYLQKRSSPNELKSSRKSKIRVQNIEFKQSKNNKNKNKVNSIHEVYFSKCRQKQDYIKQSNIKNQAQIKADQNIFIPVESHKNPIGRNKLITAQKRRQKQQNAVANQINNKYQIQSKYKQSTSMRSSLQYSQNQSSKQASILKIKSQHQNNRLQQNRNKKQNDVSMILKDKEYSICSNSMNNLSKMSMKQIESQIKLQMEPHISQNNIPPTTVFLIDESIIIRGINEDISMGGDCLRINEVFPNKVLA